MYRLMASIDALTGIDWTGLSLVGTGEEDAWTCLLREKPDIVILDESDNAMKILEMFYTDTPYNPEPFFIILTDRENLKKYQNNVQMYPYEFFTRDDKEGVASALVNAVHYLNNHRAWIPADDLIQQIMVNSCFYKFLNGWFKSNEECKNEMRELDINFEYPMYCVVFLKDRSKSNKQVPAANLPNPNGGIFRMVVCIKEMISRICSRYFPFLVIPWHVYGYAVILGMEDNNADRISRIEKCVRDIVISVEQYIGTTIHAGIGCIANWERISLSFHEALTASEQCKAEDQYAFFSKVSYEHEISDSASFILSNGVKLRDAIISYNLEEIDVIIENIRVFILKSDLGIGEASAICSGIIHYISVSSHRIGQILSDFFDKENDMYYELMSLNTVSQVMAWVDKLGENLRKSVQWDFEMKQGWLVKNIKKYIANHYSEPINQAAVAKELNVSPGYLSSLFKKYTKVGFAEYIALEKIMHAKELLAKGSMKIYQVSDALGYSDPFYFSKVFKKHTGMSPKVYVEGLRQASRAPLMPVKKSIKS